MSFLVRLGALALSLVVVGCGARTNLGGSAGNAEDAGASFPVGTYTQCAFGTVSSGPFVLPSGFDDGATLTITESGDTRTATYVESGGHTDAWTFTTTTSASATLAPSAQTTDGFGNAMCVYGIGVSNEKFFPLHIDATSGALTYQSGAVFVSLEGALTSHTDCGDMSAPTSVWIGCTNGPAPAISAPTSASALPLGDYACTSQVGTRSINSFITSGGTGALTLTQNGSHVTAKYTGDAELTGQLDLTSATNRTLTTHCALDPASETLSVTAASLSESGGTVFLSFAGTMGPSCPTTEKIGTLVCSKK